MSILVTGGAGYIGSHCVRILEDSGISTVVVDNLVKGHIEALPKGYTKFYRGDIADSSLTDKIFRENEIDSVISFAAFSLVGESVSEPYEYYKNNVNATNELLHSMVTHGVKKIVFSSTAAIYGNPVRIPISEDDPKLPVNTYGRTKLAVEGLLESYAAAYNLKYAALRYFNVAGAHESAEIGEDHNPETHLIPVILSTALGKRDKITVFGDDYDTKDGTNVRDYIDVSDLIDAHKRALDKLDDPGISSLRLNLGSGGGYSNLEVITAAREVTGHAIPLEIGARRAGDPDTLIASSAEAEKMLGWKRGKTDIREIIETAWKWHSSHPNGYSLRSN
ncbi:UDP-glucose 4-epimerase GalE [Clostridia bacterium]|nr:UDP-glucose 4-epimerase GalE [Clostridia bacterium]